MCIPRKTSGIFHGIPRERVAYLVCFIFISCRQILLCYCLISVTVLSGMGHKVICTAPTVLLISLSSPRSHSYISKEIDKKKDDLSSSGKLLWVEQICQLLRQAPFSYYFHKKICTLGKLHEALQYMHVLFWRRTLTFIWSMLVIIKS